MLWSQRRNSSAHGAENSIQISALAGVGPWHLAAADVATRLARTPPFSRLLRHAGGYSRTILTPNLDASCSYLVTIALFEFEASSDFHLVDHSIGLILPCASLLVLEVVHKIRHARGEGYEKV